MPFQLSAGDIATTCSPWFSVRLTESTAPWAYCKGDPYKTIAALELLATLVALVTFRDKLQWLGTRSQAAVGLPELEGFTDSQVATRVASRMSSTSFPLCAVAMELSAQLERRQLRLSLEWSPREVNQEADDLTNEKFGAFHPEHRIAVDLNNLPWIYLPQAMREGQEFYAATRTIKSNEKDRALRGKRRPLRETDPW